MKNLKIVKKFLILFGYIKKIKNLGKITFIEIKCNYFNLNLFVKNKIKIKKTIIGIYGFYYNEFILYEFCFYKKKYILINIKNIMFKFKLINYTRLFFTNLKYLEIDTPSIESFSNTGSKQFILLNKNKNKTFFSLSQSPQKTKQFYMFNNIIKYYSIVKCYRDEDLRSNRLKEFLQIDLENSFTSFLSLKKIINLFLKSLFFYFLNKYIYIYTIKKNIFNIFFFEKKNFKIPYLYKKIKIKKINFFIFKSYFKINKIFKKKFFTINYKKYFIIIYKHNIKKKICYFLEFYFRYNNYINLNIIIFWIVNNNYFKKGEINHHQFTSNKNFFKKILYSKSLAYDLNIYGIEVGGGSIRNINFLIQKKILNILKIKKSNFINYLNKSIPQHCGIAIGVERLISVILNTHIKNIISYNEYNKNIKESYLNE